MGAQTALSRSLALLSCAASLTLLAVAGALELPRPVDPAEGRPDPWLLVVLLMVIASYPLVGALLAIRRPTNRIGWLFCGMGLALGVSLATGAYVAHAVALRVDSLPGLAAAAWISSWVWVFAISVSVIFALLLFPDGRLPSRRWRPVAWFTLAAGFLAAGSSALRPGPFDELDVDNPLGVAALAELAPAVEGPTTLGLFVLMIVAAVSVIVRFRSARGVERQQLKWFVSVALTAVGSLAVAGALVLVLSLLGTEESDVTNSWLFPVANAGWVLGIAAISALPVAVAIAILRYRLYAIDVIIRRTLVYGALTGLLGAVYGGGVLLLTQILTAVAQAEELAVAASTLAVAALFQPARRRIKHVVDRRFYRSSYDRERVAATFASQIRDGVDIVWLTRLLRDTTAAALHPTQVFVWLRRGERP